MNKRNFTAVPAMCLVCALLFGACTGGNSQQPSGSGSQTTQTETTQQKTLMDEIRSETFSDVPAYSLYYDTACYMLYYGIMDAKDGAFAPYEMMTRKDGADAFCKLTGKTMDAEIANPDAPLTRANLAVMLYETAKHLGYDIQISGTDITYSDVELKYADMEQAETAWKTAALWATEKGLLRCFADYRFLPNTAVSRLQLAQAIIGLKSIDKKDEAAVQIHAALPSRNTESKALENHDAIQAAVDAAAKKYGAEGLQVAVVENGVVTDTYAYGWATRNEAQMTADHKLRIASISKVAVGLTAQLLREEGVIDLDADISQYWDCTVKNPKYPTMPITIRGMLTHTSSILNAGDNEPRTYASVRKRLQGTGFTNAVPGDIGYWVYNNYAFGVLGMTLELAADRVVDDILQENLYGPMDIDAAFGAGDIKNTDLLATLYRAGGEVARSVAEQKKLHSDPTPGAKGTFFAGGMTSSAYDLAKLIALIAGDGMYEGVQLMDAESVGQMESYIEPAVPGGSYQALPMRYWPELYGREGIFFHTGSAYGVFNCFCYDPQTRDGVVVLTTGASGSKDEYGIYKVCAEINAEIYNVIQ